MIAVVGKIGVGKTTFLKEMQQLGYKIFIGDEFVAKNYQKDGLLYPILVAKIGHFLVENESISKTHLKNWISENPSNLDTLEKLIFPIIAQHLLENKYDFGELPILASKNYDFSACFSGILCLETNNKKRFLNLKKRNVDNFTLKLIDEKNDPKYVKTAFFNVKPIVNIYSDNFTNIAKNEKLLSFLLAIK